MTYDCDELLLSQFDPTKTDEYQSQRQVQALNVIEAVLQRRNSWEGGSISEVLFCITIYFAENLTAEASLAQLVDFLFSDVCYQK